MSKEKDMEKEEPGLPILMVVLCAFSGAFIGVFSLLASLKGSGQANYQATFICFTIGIVGALIVLSIREAAGIIVAQLKKEE